MLLDEITDAPAEVVKNLRAIPENCIEKVLPSLEANELRDCYLSQRVVGKASTRDAEHIVLATVAKADMIVSWNFKHIVHYEKIQGFNTVNLAQGYSALQIYCPKEVI